MAANPLPGSQSFLEWLAEEVAYLDRPDTPHAEWIKIARLALAGKALAEAARDLTAKQNALRRLQRSEPHRQAYLAALAAWEEALAAWDQAEKASSQGTDQ